MLEPSPIHKAASKDPSRPVLTAVHLTTDSDGRRWLEATDSYKLARVPACGADESDTDGLIPAAAFAHAAKGGRAVHRSAPLGTIGVAANGTARAVNPKHGALELDRPEGTFPKCEQLMPQNESSFRIGLNAKLLAELAEALGAESGMIEIRFTAGSGGDPNPLRPLLVLPHGTGGRYSDAPAHERPHGLLMPVKLGDYREPFPPHTRPPESK